MRETWSEHATSVLGQGGTQEVQGWIDGWVGTAQLFAASIGALIFVFFAIKSLGKAVSSQGGGGQGGNGMREIITGIIILGAALIIAGAAPYLAPLLVDMGRQSTEG